MERVGKYVTFLFLFLLHCFCWNNRNGHVDSTRRHKKDIKIWMFISSLEILGTLQDTEADYVAPCTPKQLRGSALTPTESAEQPKNLKPLSFYCIHYDSCYFFLKVSPPAACLLPRNLFILLGKKRKKERIKKWNKNLDVMFSQRNCPESYLLHSKGLQRWLYHKSA